MKAVVYKKESPSNLLHYTEVEKPSISEDEMLIKVVAVSINAADYRSMQLGMIPKRKIFGADVAGVVEEVGKNIRQFVPGDEVVGDLVSCGFGGLAEYAVSDGKAVVKKPAGLSFEDAAAIPVAAVTALQALRCKGKINSTDHPKKVLIVGSGGGVGTFAIQLARNLGAEVTAVCSSANAEQSYSLGAGRVIDYRKEEFLKMDNRYDLILALNGGYPLMGYRKILNPGGKCVVVGGSLAQIFKTILFGWFFSIGSKKLSVLTAKSNQEDLEYLMKLAAEGAIKPVIDRRYPLEKAPEAMRYLKEGHAHGKVVITV